MIHKGIVKLFASLALVFTLTFSYAETPKQIQVYGTGVVSSVPDELRFSIFFDQKGLLATKLNGELKQQVNLVVQMLLDNEIQENQIKTLPVQLQPWFEGRGAERKQSGFELSQQIQITLTEFANYTAILDEALKIGASRISGGNFSASNTELLYDSALANALTDAQNRARFIAKNMGVQLGSLVSVTEQSTLAPNPANSERMRTVSITNNSLLPGQITTQASVIAIFRIEE